MAGAWPLVDAARARYRAWPTQPSPRGAVRAASTLGHRGVRARAPGAVALEDAHAPVAEGAHQDLHHLGGELGARLLLELSDGLLRGEPRAIGTVGGHGIERVGHVHDLGSDRDLVPAQTIRISFSVHAFVMVADQVGGLL